MYVYCMIVYAYLYRSSVNSTLHVGVWPWNNKTFDLAEISSSKSRLSTFFCSPEDPIYKKHLRYRCRDISIYILYIYIYVMNLHMDNTSWIILGWGEVSHSFSTFRRSAVGGSGLVLLRPVGSTIRTHSPDGPDSQLDLVDPETSGDDNPRVDC